jgi:hypothetical protein
VRGYDVANGYADGKNVGGEKVLIGLTPGSPPPRRAFFMLKNGIFATGLC